MSDDGRARTVLIYGLVDPRDDQIYYVGQTRIIPRVRLSQHKTYAKHVPTARLSRWLRELDAENLSPDVTILEEVHVDNADQAEQRWIAKLHKDHGLANTAHTGQPSLTVRAIHEEQMRQLAALRESTKSNALPLRPLPTPRETIRPEELRAIRERLGLSQHQLAKALGYHYSAVSRWESGNRQAPPSLRAALEAVERDMRPATNS